MYSDADAPPGSIATSGGIQPAKHATGGGLLGFLEDATRVYGTYQATRTQVENAKKATTANPTIPAPNVITQGDEKPWTERPEVLLVLVLGAVFLLKG